MLYELTSSNISGNQNFGVTITMIGVKINVTQYSQILNILKIILFIRYIKTF